MFSIDDKETVLTGIYFKRGSVYDELGKLPKPKEAFFNNWPDQHGKDYDETVPMVFEALEYNISCYLIANDIGEYLNKRDELLAILMKPTGFTLFSNTLGRAFHLRYLDSTFFHHVNPVWSNGKLYIEFMLKLENNFKPTDGKYYLTTGGDYLLTENNEYLVITEKKVFF